MKSLLLAFCATALAQAPPNPATSLPRDIVDTVAPATADVGAAMPFAAPAPPAAAAGVMPAFPVAGYEEPRGLFQSDHAFDGFTGPLSNPVQTKDPRSLTEARVVFMNNWARPGTPVLGSGSIQVYALQLRVALTERLQLFADKDGIVRLSPNPGKSVTGLANIAAGLKYAWIRDVENQFIFSTAVQYEAPTGYANIYQNQGSGLLGVYGILGKEFGNDYHLLLQFGENIALQNQQSGYFLTSLHFDRRFGRFTPFYEANWFYYNQPGKFLPIGMEGGGWVNIGASKVNGLNYVTNAVGFKFDLTEWAELGVGYEFQLSNRYMLLYNMLHAQLILRY